jgi:hypothetical protein
MISIGPIVSGEPMEGPGPTRSPGYVAFAVLAPFVFGCLGFFGVFAFLSMIRSSGAGDW